jgi:hypothetical protein
LDITLKDFFAYFREELMQAIRGKGGFQGLRKVIKLLLNQIKVDPIHFLENIILLQLIDKSMPSF